MLLDGNVDVLPGGQTGHGALQGVLLTLHPGGDQEHGGILAQQALEDLRGAAGLGNLDHIAGLDLIGGNVDLPAVDGEVGVAHQLTGLTAGHGEALVRCIPIA